MQKNRYYKGVVIISLAFLIAGCTSAGPTVPVSYLNSRSVENMSQLDVGQECTVVRIDHVKVNYFTTTLINIPAGTHEIVYDYRSIQGNYVITSKGVTFSHNFEPGIIYHLYHTTGPKFTTSGYTKWALPVVDDTYQASADESILVLKRTNHTYQSNNDVTIIFDGKRYLSLANGEGIRIRVPNGSHTISAQMDDTWGSSEALEIEANANSISLTIGYKRGSDRLQISTDPSGFLGKR